MLWSLGFYLWRRLVRIPGKSSSLPDNPENRTAAAKRYMEAMPPKEMLQGLATKVTPNLPEKDRKAFTEVMNSGDLETAASPAHHHGRAGKELYRGRVRLP